MATDVATQQVTPRTAGFAAPARTAPHARTLVSWPTGRDVWGAHRARALAEYAALIEAIARFEPVSVVADPAQPPRRASSADSPASRSSSSRSTTPGSATTARSTSSTGTTASP